MRFFYRGSVSLAALAAASICAVPALAQTASSPTPDNPAPAQPAADPQTSEPVPPAAGATEPNPADDIIVTAQKRTERLVDVPLAVTAVSGDALASRQINDAQSLTRAVPSLSYQQGGAPNNSSFRIRGVGTSLFGSGVEPAVSVVVDGVVAARAASGFSDLLDVERIEVLRGPQGTLFGKNATAGVINIVTARPSSTFGGNLEATVAEHNEYRVKGSLTGPLSDTLTARISGFYNNVQGNLLNIADGKYEGGTKSWGVRAKLEWKPTDNLDLLLSGDYRKADANCCSSVYVRVANPIVATLLLPLIQSSTGLTMDSRSVNNDNLAYVRQRTKTVSLQADWDLGSASVTSITAWQGYKEENQAEVDQIRSPVPLFLGTGAAYVSFNYQPALQRFNSYTQELRIASNGKSDLTYVAGIFLTHFDLFRTLSRQRQTCAKGVLYQACAAPINQSSGFDGTFKSDNGALFGQIDWRVVGGLHLIGGLRGQYEKQEVTGRQFGPVFPGDALLPGTVLTSGTTRRQGGAITGKAGVRYEFSRNMQAYATYTRGYKAFALDLNSATPYATQTGLNPERVNGYELGYKVRTEDGKFDLNAALFRSDYTNLQTQTVILDPANGTFVAQQVNAGKSRTQGFELEANVRPSRQFSVGLSFSYTDATIDVNGQQCGLQQQAAAPILTANFPINSCYRKRQTVNGVVQTSTPIVDVVGGQLPLAPKFRVTVSPKYETDIGSTLKFSVQANLSYQSSEVFALNQDPLLVDDGYTLVDASASIGDAKDRFKLSLFVRNIFNQSYYTNIGHASLLATVAQPFDLTANFTKDSRRYGGATLSFRF